MIENIPANGCKDIADLDRLAVHYRERGLSDAKIAVEIGVSEADVSGILARLNVQGLLGGGRC